MSASRRGRPGNGTLPASRIAAARRIRTRAVHAGTVGGPVHPVSNPIAPGTAFACGDAGIAAALAATGQPMYSRDGMPNALALEGAVADLEGAADAHAVASGMAAVSLTVLTLLSSGDHVVVCGGGYQDTAALLLDHVARFGVGVTVTPSADPAVVAAALTPATRLVLTETIANPGMTLADLPALAAVAHRAGALLVVDNTFATPALCRPIEHGADLVLHSAGKFLGGHHDATGGIIAGPAATIDRVRRAGYLFGPLLSPFDAWLILRGIRTLAPRMSWASASAAKIATALAAHPGVSAVRYPGLRLAPTPTGESAHPATPAIAQPNETHGEPRPGMVTGIDTGAPSRGDADDAGDAAPTARDRPTGSNGTGDLIDRLLPDGAGALLAFDLAGGAPAAFALTRHLRDIPYVASVGGTATILSFPPGPPRGPVSDPLPHYGGATLRLSVGLEDPRDLVADLTRALDRVHAAHPPIPRPDAESAAAGRDAGVPVPMA